MKAKSIIAKSIIAGVASVTLLITPPVHAASLFGFHPLRHMIGHKARTTAEVGIGATVVGALTADEVLATALTTSCALTGCAQNAVDEVRAFLRKHRIAGHSEMAHAMKKEAEANPEKIPAISDLAKKTGVKFAGDGMEPPGDCSQDDYDRYVENVEEFCKDSAPNACKDDRTASLEDRVKDWTKSLAGFEQCHIARKTIMDQCFKGGDGGHRIQLDQAKNAMSKCQSLITKYRGKL